LLREDVKRLKNFSCPSHPAPNSEKLSAPVESTSIPKAHLPFENVAAKLSNRLSFTGYLLDTLLLRRQNIACFALTEAECQVSIPQDYLDGHSYLVSLFPNLQVARRRAR
jgi:hypothetical protein